MTRGAWAVRALSTAKTSSDSLGGTRRWGWSLRRPCCPVRDWQGPSQTLISGFRLQVLPQGPVHLKHIRRAGLSAPPPGLLGGIRGLLCPGLRLVLRQLSRVQTGSQRVTFWRKKKKRRRSPTLRWSGSTTGEIDRQNQKVLHLAGTRVGCQTRRASTGNTATQKARRITTAQAAQEGRRSGEAAQSISAGTGTWRILSEGVTGRSALTSWSWPRRWKKGWPGGTSPAHCCPKTCNGGSRGRDRGRGWSPGARGPRLCGPDTGTFAARPKAYHSTAIQCGRGRVLDSSARTPGFSAGVYRYGRRRNLTRRVGCPAGDWILQSARWHLVGCQRARRPGGRYQKGDAKVLQKRPAASPYLPVGRSWSMPSEGRKWVASDNISLVPTGRLCCRLPERLRLEEGSSRTQNGARGPRTREEEEKETRRRGTPRGNRYREEAGCFARDLTASYVCRASGKTTFGFSSRWKAGWIPGWSLEAAWGKPCCSGADESYPRQREGGDGRSDARQEQVAVEDPRQEEEQSRGSASSGGALAAAEPTKEGIESEPEKEEKKAKRATEEQRRRQQLLGQFVGEQLVAPSPQEEVHEGPWVGAENARASGLRIPGAGWHHGPREGGGDPGAAAEAGNLLPAGLEAQYGPAKQRCQRTGSPLPSAGHAARRSPGRDGRLVSRSADGSRDGDKTRLGHSASPGDQCGGGRYHSSSCAVSSTETWKTGREGWRKRKLEPVAKLVSRLVRLQRKGCRQAQGRKRQGQERQGKRPRRKRLGSLGKPRWRKRRLKEGPRRGPLKGEEALSVGKEPASLGDNYERGIKVREGPHEDSTDEGAGADIPGPKLPCDADLEKSCMPGRDMALAADALHGQNVGTTVAPALWDAGAVHDRESGLCGPGVNLGTQASYDEWLGALSQVSSIRQLGILLAWGQLSGHMLFGISSAGPPQAAARTKRGGGLFPLPVNWPADFFHRWQERFAAHCTGFSVECWVALVCVSLNCLYGYRRQGPVRQAGKVHAAALEGLRSRVCRFLSRDDPKSSLFGEVVRELRERRVSYTGEEVSQPMALTAEQIAKSLPPEGHGGCIPVVKFLKGRTKFLVENPLESFIPVQNREPGPMQAKVHIQKGAELQVFGLLENRGVISWLPVSEVFGDETGYCLNGLFGVVKPGKFTSSNTPVLRVIMNLIPANRLFQVILGDVQLLPSGAAWIPLVVSEQEELRVSQGDMSAAFYLYSIPEAWHRYLCFNFAADGAAIGRVPGVLYRPCCVVLPMGWNSSVGIMQQLSRELLLMRDLPAGLEVHKGRPVPSWFTNVVEQATAARAWWQVYLDNFMAAERVDGNYKELDMDLQAQAMRAWHAAGVLTADDKQVLGALDAVELGIRLDGHHGLLGASAERLFKTSLATIRILQLRGGSKKEAQIVLGRWVFILQFRRAAMGVLSRSWDAIESLWASPKAKNLMLQELQMLLCLGPILQTDLRCDYDGVVTCSDASETGGAAAQSIGLSWSGQSLVSSLQNPLLRPLEYPFLIISVFNGVGGAFRLYDILGITPLGRISIEISKDANRVTRCTWPGVEELLDVEELTKADVQRWANMYPRALEVHLWAGFPCVHLSRVRAYRQNLQGDGSRLFWKLLELLRWVQEVFGLHAKVRFCIENVASMDEEARREISHHLDVQPVKLDPSDTLPFNRPRLAWCSETLYEMEELSLWTEGDYVRAYVEAGEVECCQWIRPGWAWPGGVGGQVRLPTFMKSIARHAPPPYPAGLNKASLSAQERWRNDKFRFPPYQYDQKYLLCHQDHEPRLLDSSERELLLGLGPGHTATCRSASAAKANWQAYEDSRKSLCGDSFAVSSFAIMAAAMCAEWAPRMKPSQIIQRLGLAPGASAHPSIAVPMGRWLAYGGDGGEDHPGDQLVRQLGLQVNHTGADVRLVTGEPMSKKGNHGSLRAWWWQWKHLFKVRWVSPAHINFLEMKMILLTLLWKARSPSAINKRWLHLEDSMVCLYILSKGRTSSRLLQPLCNKIGAVQLFLGVTVLHGHVPSLENPTDAGSRQWCRGWLLVHFLLAVPALTVSGNARVPGSGIFPSLWRRGPVTTQRLVASCLILRLNLTSTTWMRSSATGSNGNGPEGRA